MKKTLSFTIDLRILFAIILVVTFFAGSAVTYGIASVIQQKNYASESYLNRLASVKSNRERDLEGDMRFITERAIEEISDDYYHALNNGMTMDDVDRIYSAFASSLNQGVRDFSLSYEQAYYNRTNSEERIAYEWNTEMLQYLAVNTKEVFLERLQSYRLFSAPFTVKTATGMEVTILQ